MFLLRSAGIALLALATSFTASAAEYELNIPSSEDPTAILVSISLEQDKTVVTLITAGGPYYDTEYCLDDVGSEHAFQLRDNDTGKTYLLKEKESELASCKEGFTTIPSQSAVTSKLIFPPLPMTTNNISLFEDGESTENMGFIKFEDIRLPENVNFI